MRLTAPLILLGASTLLTVLLGWQAFTAAASHRALAERVLRDYAELAAIEFSRRTTAYIGNYGVVVSLRAMTQAARDAGSPLPSRAALEAAMPEQSKRARELVGPTFRFDASSAEFRFEREELPLQARAALLDLARGEGSDRLRSLHQTLEGQTRLYVIAPADDGRTASLQWHGFEVSLGAVVAWIAEFIAQEPLLPTSLVSEEAAQSSLVVSVRAPDGSSIFRLPDRDSSLPPLASRDLAGQPAITGLSGFRVDVALDPAAAGSLVIGGLPRSQTPFLLALLVLSAALTLAAGVQIRRERRHAQMRHDFITRASHELRTPVARIRMFTETLLLGRVRSEEERAQTLQALDRGARRLSMLIDNVLQLSPTRSLPRKAGEGRGAVDAVTLVDEIVSEFATSVAARDAITVTAPRALPARLDTAAFRQVLMNLLDNAWKYGGSPKAIRVELSGTDSEITVAVEDNGPGVPETERERIWEPYVRLDRDRRSAIAGTGIGLAVVRELVRANGGSYCVVEGSASSARFVVTFPVVAA